ncbi:hypothetical protein BWD162_002220 [Bartonella sp. WD16.2]|nr:hypothetical protein BWD162_002220 [Bartonella sp. WD16.2]
MIKRKHFLGIVAMFVYFSSDILSYEKLGIYIDKDFNEHFM